MSDEQHINREIKGVYGAIPYKDEDQVGYIIGYDGVTKILRRVENLGTYGIIWYDVYKGDTLHASLTAMQISEITYTE